MLIRLRGVARGAKVARIDVVGKGKEVLFSV